MEKKVPGHSYVIAAFLFLSLFSSAQSETGKPTLATSATGIQSSAADCNFGDFSLPNAFTPNGDGSNDLFCLEGWNTCIEKFSVLIFDRWGRKIYESDNPSFCWDGSVDGKIMETDVVIFSVKASFTNGLEISKTGNITLIR